MAAKQKPCTVGEKHSWTFVKNVTLTDLTIRWAGSRAHIRYRGLYRCACGEHKYGREGNMPVAASQAAEERKSLAICQQREHCPLPGAHTFRDGWMP